MKLSFAFCLIALLGACAHPSPAVRVAADSAALDDEVIGPGHFRIYLANNGFADQQSVDELFARRARELCAGAFEPLSIRYGGHEAPRGHLAGVARGMLPLNAEVVCAAP
jgi:hypothetical protein